MKILVTNDDGILSDGLWALAKELKSIAQVVVVAPDREQSAIGTAVTLSHPLRIQKVKPMVPETEAYSVQGTPADSVILALEKLVKNEIDLVISGINQGLNLGNDVLISGTVGAALQGYLRGFPAIAISVSPMDSPYLSDVAKVAALLAERIHSAALPANTFLNVNLPDLPLSEIKGVNVTRLAGESHIDTVEEGHDGKRQYYWLVRQKMDRSSDDMTDIKAIEQGYISITPLHAYLGNKPSLPATDGLYSGLLQRLQKNQG
ncbi:5'/3'-nucleotidase SurE [Chloroflexota bacterium]